MNAQLVLAIAALALWVGWLYVAPFGRCPKCSGAGTIRSGPRRMKVCPRCKGRRRVQRHGSRLVHRAVFRVRDGQRAAAKYTEED
jgi:Ribonuclease G/E